MLRMRDWTNHSPNHSLFKMNESFKNDPSPWLEVARQDIYWHIGREVILMIPLRILIIIKLVFDYRDLKNSQ